MAIKVAQGPEANRGLGDGWGCEGVKVGSLLGGVAETHLISYS